MRRLKGQELFGHDLQQAPQTLRHGPEGRAAMPVHNRGKPGFPTAQLGNGLAEDFIGQDGGGKRHAGKCLTECAVLRKKQA